MLAALQNPYVWFALALGLWAMWRLLRWAASGGRLPLRGGRRGTASAFANAGLAVQSLYQPGAKQVLERKAEEEAQREDEDEGNPPLGGRPGADGGGRPPV